MKIQLAGTRIGPVTFILLYRMALAGYMLAKGGRVSQRIKECIIEGKTLI